MENKRPYWRQSRCFTASGLRSARSLFVSNNTFGQIGQKTYARVHVLHITTAQEMEFLALNKDIASVEVLPIT